MKQALAIALTAALIGAVLPAAYAAPHIIHVPQAGDGNRADIDNDRSSEDDVTDTAPPPPRRLAPLVRRTEPRWPAKREATPAPQKSIRRIEMTRSSHAPAQQPAPQPPGPRRAVLSAPPPPMEGPSPIKPTPKFGARADAAKAGAAGDSFAAAGAPQINESSPPPGYMPPAAAPHVEQPDGSNLISDGPTPDDGEAAK